MPKKVFINGGELFDNDTQQFISVKPIGLVLEHCLVSISRWESKFHKPFLVDKPEKTPDEMFYYMKCMVLNHDMDDIDDNIFKCCSQEVIDDIIKYIKDPQTATTITIRNKKKNRDIITSELIYYWMCANYIPFSCETWPLNRLLTLVEICSVKNDPKQGKMSTKDILSQNHALNMARRAKLGSLG